MDKIPRIENTEFNPYLSKDEISDMKFQRQLFADPIKRLKKTKDNLIDDGHDEEKIEAGILESLEMIIECLDRNDYGFEKNIPEQLRPLFDTDEEADEEAQENAYLYWMKNVGVSKTVLRSWVVEKFHDYEDDELDSSQEALAERDRLKRMLSKIEASYE